MLAKAPGDFPISSRHSLTPASFEADIRAVRGIGAVDNILEVICRSTGMGFAAVARVTQDRWIACQIRDEIAFGLRPGDELRVETTICGQVRDDRQPVFIDHVAHDNVYRLHPTPALYGFQSYVSVPITLKDGMFFGTLCAIGPNPALVNTPATAGMFKLFAELIAFHLDADDRVERLERRVAERTAERNLLADIVETTDLMIMGCDPDYTVLAINRARAHEFVRLYGVQPKVGDNLLALFADQPAHQAQLRAEWARGLSGEEVTIVEAYGDPRRARPTHEVKFRTLWNAQGDRAGCYQFVTDVTERLARQALLAEAQETLRQSQKMDSVGRLTGGLAHDFNNLLTGITGSLELLQTRVTQGRTEGIGRYITAAQGAATRAAALTHRLLAFSRRQTLEPQPTDLNRLVAGMQDLIDRTMGPAITVRTVAAAGLWTTLVDPGQLENAMLNLCINARDAMPGGGTLTIETANHNLDESAAREREVAPGDYVSLCVIDDGSGMAPDVMARAFDPFFTTKRIGEGTGLGLSMIYGFAKQSGGHTRITSDIGQGTTVCLYLPRHAGAAWEMVSSDPPAEPLRAGHSETVLVVDDEPTVRMLVAEVLTGLGYTTIEAADGAAGLDVMRSDARIDLLVTDVGLPGGMNGRQMADQGRALRPGLKVLFITGYAESAVLSHGNLDAGMHVMTKPFAMDALTRKISKLLDDDSKN